MRGVCRWFQVGVWLGVTGVNSGCASESSLSSPQHTASSGLPASTVASASASVTTNPEGDDSGGNSAPDPTGSSAEAATPNEPSSTSVPATNNSAQEDDSLGGAESTVPPSVGGETRVTSSPSSTATESGSDTFNPIEALAAFLDMPADERPAVLTKEFASTPLSKEQAEQALDLLWRDHVTTIETTRRAEHDAKSITIEDKTLKYDFTVFGEAPATGHSLVISLHGGGEADASVNDEQWENQKILYTLEEGIYLAPRAPTNTWNLWHEAHIDPLFERLIANFIALEGVDPNRVYVMGYSAGGDGVYQLGPRMADHWAAASAMAGHPNEAKPFSLRNTGFTIHVGGDDTAFDRNLVAVQWRDELDSLQAADPEGYEHVVEVHQNKGHWMDRLDAVAVPWMTAFTRNPVPNRVVWYQDDILHERSYWLHAVEPAKETTVIAELTGQTVALESDDVAEVGVRLRDDMLDLDQSVTISANGETSFEGKLERTIGTMYRTLEERGDPTLVFTAETAVQF
jgi:poly(3-hydroxybutyrate) depolymerase